MKTAQHAQRHTYPATFALFSWIALVVFSIIFGVLLITEHPKHGAPDPLLTNELVGAAVIAAFLSFFFQLAHCRVATSPFALIVVHPTRRYVFPWDQVADVEVGRDGGMRIVLRDRSNFVVYCFGGSIIGLMTRGIRARKACEGIKAAMAQAASPVPASTVTSALDIQWKIMLAIWVAATALSVTGWVLAPHHVLV